MNSNQRGFLSWAMAFVCLAAAEFLGGVCQADTRKTDAQNDGMTGPIRSVMTKQEIQKIDLPAENREMWVIPVICGYCEYDREGNRARMGQLNQGQFQGEVAQITRDGNGKIIEKRFEDNNGEPYRAESWGPFGITEQTGFANGKVTSHSTWSYDANGHVAESHSYDQDGVEIGSSISLNGVPEHNRDEWDFGKGGVFQLHFIETYDPKTDFWTFTNLNQDGSVKVAVETSGTKVVSYRQNTPEPNVFGSGLWMDPADKKQVSYRCHADSTCDEITAYCRDEACRLVERAEWRGPTGSLKLRVEYEYELDQFGNWTKRAAWVSGSELSERTLAETDYRELQYWTH